MSKDVRSLRSQILHVARDGEPHGRRYPSPLRAAVVDHTRCRLDRGESVSAVADSLGLSGQTLSYWLRSGPTGAPPRATPAMRPVSVVPADDTADQSLPPGRPVLVTPRGLRIEGLDVDALVELVQRLG